jgi:hypothetical protein
MKLQIPLIARLKAQTILQMLTERYRPHHTQGRRSNRNDQTKPILDVFVRVTQLCNRWESEAGYCANTREGGLLERNRETFHLASVGIPEIEWQRKLLSQRLIEHAETRLSVERVT